MRQNFIREQHGLIPTELVGYELSPLRNKGNKGGVHSLPRAQIQKNNDNISTLLKKKQVAAPQISLGINSTQLVTGGMNNINLSQNVVIKNIKTIEKSGEEDKNKGASIIGQNVPQVRVSKYAKEEIRTKEQQIISQQPQHLRSSSTGTIKGQNQLKPTPNKQVPQFVRQSSQAMAPLQQQQFAYPQSQQLLSSVPLQSFQIQQFLASSQVQLQSQSQQLPSKRKQSKVEWGASTNNNKNDNEDEEEEEIFEYNIWDNDLLLIRGIDCEKWTTSDGKAFTLFHLYKARYGTYPTQRETIQNKEVISMMKRFSRNRRNKNLDRFPWETFDDMRTYADETDLFGDKNFLIFSKHFQSVNEIRKKKLKIIANNASIKKEMNQTKQQDDKTLTETEFEERKASFFLKKSGRSMSQANTVNLATIQQSQNNTQFRIRQLSNSSHMQTEASSPLKYGDPTISYYQQPPSLLPNISNSPTKVPNPISPTRRVVTYHYQSPSLTPVSNTILPQQGKMQRTFQKTQDSQSFTQIIDNIQNPNIIPKSSEQMPQQSPALSHQSQSEQNTSNTLSPQRNSSQQLLHSSSPQQQHQQHQQTTAPSFKLQLIQAMRNPAPQEEKSTEEIIKKENEINQNKNIFQKTSSSSFNQTQQSIELIQKQHKKSITHSTSPLKSQKLQQQQSPQKGRNSTRNGSSTINQNTSITQLGGEQNGNNNNGSLIATNANNSKSTTLNGSGNKLHLKNLNSQFHLPSPFNNEITSSKMINIQSQQKQ